MSDTFDWFDLLIDVICKRIEEGDPAAAAYLRSRIEERFVPVERYNAHTEMFRMQLKIAIEATARAEAAEARNKVLEEALRAVDALIDQDDAARDVIAQALGAEHGK